MGIRSAKKFFTAELPMCLPAKYFHRRNLFTRLFCQDKVIFLALSEFDIYENYFTIIILKLLLYSNFNVLIYSILNLFRIKIKFDFFFCIKDKHKKYSF